MYKRTATIIFLSIISISGYSQKNTRIDLKPKSTSLKNIEIVNDNSTGIIISETLTSIELEEKETKEGTFLELSSEKLTKSFDKGKPNLPLITRLIDIPLNKKLVIKEISFEEEIIELKDYHLLKEIIPAQPSLSKSDDPNKVPFYKNKELYERNEFFKNDLIKFEDKGFLRNKHLGYLEISPFEYNPVQNTLKVKNNIKVEINFVEDEKAKSVNSSNLTSSYFENLPLNTINESTTDKGLISGPVKYVIVSDRMFEETLEPFITWKTMKGFNVVEAYTDDPNVGNTTTTIKAYLKDLYENPGDGIPPTFVLIVGDVAQIPAFSGVAGGHYTDLYYCEYTDDKLPEVFYGRFSAESIEELVPQINKTLEIEKYQMPNPAYLDNVVLIAGVDGTYASTRGNGFVNYASTYYANSENGVTAKNYLYPASGSADLQIRTDISEGVALANYTAHCGSSGWSDPSFSIGHIADLTNEHMYPLIIGNCCQSNTFYNNDCFGEELLKAANKGAVGYIGGSNLTYWDEDYYWGVGLSSISANPTYENSGLGSYDRFFHMNGESKQDWYITQGQINVAGNLAIESSSSNLKAYYWEIYHLMGDPSLTPFITVPEVMISSYNSEIVTGLSSFQVSTEENAYVAVSVDGVLLDAKLVDETGSVELEFAPLENIGIMDLVITKQNRQPVIDEITIVPATTPYVVVDIYTIIDDQENNNSKLEFDEIIDLDIQLKNLSDVFDAFNVNAKLVSLDTNLLIIDSTEFFSTILSLDSVLVEKAFTIDFKSKFSDQQQVKFDVEITGEDADGLEYTWVSKIRLHVNAPEIQIDEVFIDDNLGDANGILDAGETADVAVVVSNLGSAEISNLKGLVSIIQGEEYLTFNNTGTEAFSVKAHSTDTVTLNATAAPGTPLGTSVYVDFDIKDQSYAYYSYSESRELNIGDIPVLKISDNDSTISSLAYFYDSGGKAAAYSNSENDTITLSATESGKYLKAEFLSFSVEQNDNTGGCWDNLYIYDGVNTDSELIGAYCNNNVPNTIVANNESGGLTFVFISDGSVTLPGWEAEIRSLVGFDYQATIQDKNGPVQGAIVEFEYRSDTSDINGIVSFSNIPEGINNSIKVTATGYSDFEKTINLFEDTSEVINLDISTYDVRFNLSDEDKPFIDGEISFDGKTIETSQGETVFSNVEYGLSKEYSIKSFGHKDSIASIDVTSDLSKYISLKAIKYNIDFLISDGVDPIQGAIVEFNGNDTLTNIDGKASFAQVNMDTALVYSVRKSGFNNITDTMNVLKDSTVNQTLESGIASYKVLFKVLNVSQPIYNAQVIFKDDTLYTNAQGVAEFDNVLDSINIPYKISKIHFNDIVGTVSVSGSNVAVEEGLTYELYDIKFIINDGTSPLVGASISFDGKSGMSDSNGEYVFSIPYSLNKTYQITKDGYTSSNNMINVVENKDINVNLTLIAYNLTFEITDDASQYIENAKIEFHGTEQFSGTDGRSIFTGIPPGENLAFTISKEGFYNYDSTLTVVNSDVLFSASMELITYDITFETVDANSNKIENAKVEFYGTEKYTDSNGKIIFNDIAPGDNLAFTITKEGYWNYDSTLNLVNENIMFNARLSSTTGLVNFNENDIKVYPNPSTGIFNLEILNLNTNNYIVKVFDVIGAVVYFKNITSSEDIKEQIDLTKKQVEFISYPLNQKTGRF